MKSTLCLLASTAALIALLTLRRRCARHKAHTPPHRNPIPLPHPISR